MSGQWLYWKAQVNWTWLLPAGCLAAMLAWTFYRHSPATGGVHRLNDLYAIFEYYLPLAATFYLAGLPTFELEQGAAETHLTYPEFPALRLLQAAAPRTLAWLALFGLAVVVASGWYYPVKPLHLAAVTAPPALAVSGAAVAAAAITRSQAGGLIAPLFWWLIDLAVPGQLDERFYLFRVSHPLPGIDLAVQTRNVCLAGIALWLFVLWLAHRRAWWLR